MSSRLAVASQGPSGEIATDSPALFVLRSVAVLTALSQIRTAPSRPAVASQVPSGAIATAVTQLMCPRVAVQVPVAGSQIRTAPSRLVVASQVPSGAIAT